MRISEKSFRIASLVLWGLALFAVAVVFFISLTGCRASRQVVENSTVSVDSSSSVVVDSLSANVASTAHSSVSSFVKIDSIRFFGIPVRQPPDDRGAPVYVPYCAAAYGVDVNVDASGSSSLFNSDVMVKKISSSSYSVDADSNKSVSSVTEDKSSSCIGGIILFIALILAAIALMRYLDRR